MDERDEVMGSGRPRIIEKVLSLALPPACREEVLGDLYEACDSSGEYIREALRVIPMVILSRIRRTADSQVLLMQATALYLSFMGSAWYEDKSFLSEDSGLLRLGIPPAWVLFGLMIDDAYARPGKRSIFKQMRGAVLGLAFAYLSQEALLADNRLLALPPRIMFFGSAVGLLLSVGVKLLFPSVIDRPAGAGGPALWLKHTAEPFRIAPEAVSIAKNLALVLLVTFVVGQIGGRWVVMALVLISVLLLIFRELRRWW